MRKAFYTQYKNTDAYSGKKLVEGYGSRGYVVQNPAAYPLTQMEMDDVYRYNYQNTYHPMYEKRGRHSGNSRSEIQPCQQPGVLWRLQLLCINLSSGKNRPDAKPRIFD